MVILEDDQFLAQFYKILINRVLPQAQILFFTNGDKAWEELTKVDPDLFITDVEHFGMDAWEMVKMLAAEKVTYPIFMISGDFVSGTKHTPLYPELRLTLLGKPFDIPVFNKLLTDLLKPVDGFMGTTEQPRPNLTQGGATGLA